MEGADIEVWGGNVCGALDGVDNDATDVGFVVLSGLSVGTGGRGGIVE